jgi:hypothetical protein
MNNYDAIEALNWSSLREMDSSPLHYRWRQDHPREDTPSMLLGRAIHCAILEPESFESRYLVRPEGLDGRTKEGKAWIADAAASGREVLTTDQGETVARCAASVLGHPECARLLSGTRREEVVTWTDPETGVACKGRLDAIAPDRLIDLKTCRDLGRLERDAYEYRYHGQLAWYLHGAETVGLLHDDAEVYLLAAETSEPYDCGALRVLPCVLDSGDRLWRRLLGLWLACRETGLWPGRYPALGALDLPRWARDGEEEW